MKHASISNKKILFILCSVRSGSTLLKNMLDQHSKIFAPAELHILPFDNLDDMELNFRNTSLCQGLVEAIIKLNKCDEAEAQRIYNDFKNAQYSSNDIYDYFLSRINECYLVDKSPTYGIHSTALNACHSLNIEAKYIHLLRHPMAVIKSSLINNFDKLARLLNCNAARALRKPADEIKSNFVFFDQGNLRIERHRGVISEGIWRDTNKNISKFLETIDRNDQMNVHYENLVNNPHQEMHRICAFLGIEYQLNMSKSEGIFSSINETVGDPNFFKRRNIKNLNSFDLAEIDDENWQIDAETIDLAIHYNYLCWESEKTIELLPTEKQYFDANKHVNNYCLITSFTADVVDKFDERRLARSLAELMIKNPNLSSVFAKEEQGWKRKLIGGSQIQISRIFCRPDDDHNIILDDYTSRWTHELDISNGPLLTIFYVYQNKQLTVRYVIHHLLMDASAMLQFHAQLWQGYSTSVTAIKDNKYNELQEFIQFCQLVKMEVDPTVENLELYPVFERQEISTYKSQKEVNVVVPKINPLLNKFSFNELSCALYDSLAPYTLSEKVSIAHRFHNRKMPGQNRKKLIAWLAADAPITLNVRQDKRSLLQSFKSEKRAVDQDSLAFKLSNQNFNLHHHCPIRFNYIPLYSKSTTLDISFDEIQSTLSFDQRNKMDYMLDFIVRESIDQFEVIVRYSSLDFSGSFIENFIAVWMLKLEEFLAVTKSPSRENFIRRVA